MESARISKDGDSSKQAVIHKKGKKQSADTLLFYPGKSQENIHCYTAQLKREIPPIIGASIHMKGQAPLLPDFTSSHDKATEEEKEI